MMWRESEEGEGSADLYDFGEDSFWSSESNFTSWGLESAGRVE